MNKQIEEQAKLAKEILLLKEQDSADAVERLKLLSTDESPSLAVVLDTLNDSDNNAKASLTEHAKDRARPL